LQLAPWATKAKYQLRTDNSFVYAQTTEPNHAENAIRFSPFAVVWMQKGKRENEEPYVIISESAYIKFANSFEDLSNPNPGRVIGGTLEGEVRIIGPDGLIVLGEDFWFSEASMSIWSDNPVRFWQGPHVGSAIGLDAELIPDEVARAKDKLAFSGVKSVRLRENVVMDLLFDDDNEHVHPHGLQKTQSAQRTPEEKKEPVTVHIQSKGSFTFGVDTHLGTFVNDVRVYRPTEPGKFDILLCDDKLTLIFEPESPEDDGLQQESARNVQAEAQIDSDQQRFQSIRSDLNFRRLHAEGRSVVLISQTNDLKAFMTDLVYDIKTRVAVLTDANSVNVKQGSNGESEIHSPAISLVHDQKGTVSSIWCKGKGWLRTSDTQSGQQQLIAQWDKQMRKYPDEKSGLDIVDLEENATLIQPEQQVSLAAGFIRFWIKKNELGKRSQFSEYNAGSQSQNTRQRDDKSEQYQLQKLVAVGNVTMDNKDMHARTKRLEAYFEQDVPGPPHSNPFFGIENKQRHRTAFQPTSYREASTHFTNRRNNRSGSEKRSSNRGPMNVTADSIRVRIIQGHDHQQAKIAEVWTNGNVNVRQSRTPGEAPLIITGNHMHVVNRSDDDQLIHVKGTPAHIRDPKMHIEGTNIHLDRGRNLAWVEGEGLLQLPVNKTLEGKKLDRTQWLDVWWTEQMKFDGETAQFFGDVRTILDNHHVSCQEMYVLLTKRLSFTDENSDED
ncbi:MAG: hypothetical protein IID46_15380, partial [Planctomycetes bacterium]|nr:hypothetical protein [Planctomycetota bacterium]